MNLYIDIDGVLLTRAGKPTEGVVEFLAWVTERCECLWLTTHCHGSADGPFLYLVGKLPPEALPYLGKIKPTVFGALKTDAIDFSEPFVWLDDTLLESERAVLREHGAEGSFVHTDINRDPTSLRHALSRLQDLCSSACPFPEGEHQSSLDRL